MPKPLSISKSCPLDHRINQICRLRRQKVDFYTLSSIRTHKSLNMVKFLKCFC
ncbi:unnamed protein product [Hymenolepis diminuta]|uniref:Uncharacterized protein n=1 Tax=Hymenolepis diminuta TaxID=6216 RepID=A0A564YA52_HYMDI|nr:unnamed protein product [Hymenolepis diminuta]